MKQISTFDTKLKVYNITDQYKINEYYYHEQPIFHRILSSPLRINLMCKIYIKYNI